MRRPLFHFSTGFAAKLGRINPLSTKPGATEVTPAFAGRRHISVTRMVIDFIQMLPLSFIAAICGAFSAQLGLMLATGFALGDLLPPPRRLMFAATAYYCSNLLVLMFVADSYLLQQFAGEVRALLLKNGCYVEPTLW